MGLNPRALFAAFCSDVGAAPVEGSIFDPFPFGTPAPGEYLEHRDYARDACVASLFKKFEDEVAESADRETIEAFAKANQACAEYCYPTDIADPALGYALTYSRLILRDWLEPPFVRRLNPHSIAEGAMFGPGASAGFKRPGTNLYFKIGSGPLTFTHPDLLDEYWSACAQNPTCEFAERLRFSRWGACQVDGGTLSLVPKSFKKRRTILVEPSLNTYFQLGVGSVLEDVLRSSTGIDFSCQPDRNARLAKEGSVNQKFATVDLKQCSDYQSLTMLRAHCPKSLVRYVERYRTPCIVEEDGQVRPLSMISTMGNGYTFPLQTLLLASVVYGVYKTLDIPFERPSLVSDGNFGVFGDDIIVVAEAYPLLTKTLSALGYVTNMDKSFAEGPFRESCGSDWFAGTNVRGVYIRSLKTKQDLFSAINRLTIWGAVHDFRLTKTMRVLTSALSGCVPFVPPCCQPVAGIVTSNPPVDVTVDRNGSFKYTEYRAQPRLYKTSPRPTYDGGFKQWSRLGPSLVEVEPEGSINEYALLKCALGGHIRNSRFAVRDREPRYHLRGCVAPNWSIHTTGAHSEMSGPALQRWCAATTELEILLSLQ